MAKLNLSRLGLSKEQVRKFKRLFFNGYALVRGKMKAVDKGYDVPVDTLIASEAWAGVVSTEEAKGHFCRVDDTGIVCITYPCPYFIERSLNTNLTDSLGEVDLAASGASDKQVELGMAELERSGLLIVGTHEILSGPAGTMNSLIASEFYSRVLPITRDEP